MLFVESPTFSRFVDEHASDEALAALQALLVERPQAGDVIPGAQGLRKLRWGLGGRGKRGGARVIYYYWVGQERIYLLFAYFKNVQSDLTPDQVKRLAAVMKQEVRDGG